MLKSLTLIDTPGVLSGEKQKAREYDFRAVTKARRGGMCVCVCHIYSLALVAAMKMRCVRGVCVCA